MAEKDPKKASEEKKQPSKPKEEAPKEQEKKTEPVNPYEEGTKSYLVAKALIAGEVNRGKVAREVGVSLNTIYNITRDLSIHGYTLAIQQNKNKSGFSTLPSNTQPSNTVNLTHGKGSKEGSESGKEGGSLSDQGGNEGESDSVVSENNLAQSGKISSESGSTVTPADLKETVKRRAR